MPSVWIEKRESEVKHAIRYLLIWRDKRTRKKIKICLSGYTKKDIRRNEIYPEEIAEARERLETILKCRHRNKPIDEVTEIWLEQHPRFRTIFERKGIVGAKSSRNEITLKNLWDSYETHLNRTCRKPSTKRLVRCARRWFFKYSAFAKEANPNEINSVMAEEFQAWFTSQESACKRNLKPNSVSGYLAKIKAVFNYGKRTGAVAVNPFENIRVRQIRRDNMFEIPIGLMPKILEACPNKEWRVYVVLLRFGGLRRSEPLRLAWEDVLWSRGQRGTPEFEAGRLRVHDRKLERFADRETRFVPLWPEIEKELLSLHNDLRGASGLILGGLPSLSTLNVKLRQIVRSAGFPRTDSLANNMRSTRDSELKRLGFSEDQRSIWFGHSELVSKRNYQNPEILVTDADYNSAGAFYTMLTTT